MSSVPELTQTAHQVAGELAASPWYEAVTPHWQTVLGAVVFLYVSGRQLADRRPPGNILAWSLLILLSPLVGLLCFMLIGERKRHAMRRLRHAVAAVSEMQPPPGIKPGVAAAPVPAFTPLVASDAVADHARILRAIAEARTHILIASYIFADDATGEAVVEALVERARAGVTVRVLIDDVGSRSTDDALFSALIAAGGRVERFMPVAIWRPGAHLRNHRKLMIFDGHTAVIGGRNISEDYHGATPRRGRFRDFGVLITGAGIAEFTRVFASDWCFTTGETPESFFHRIGGSPTPDASPAIEVVAGGPDYPNDPIWERLLTMLAQARHDIVIVTPYLIPDEPLLRIIAAKARAGVRVRIVTPRRSDHRIADFARRHPVRVLREAGASVFYYDDAFLHGKLVLVDGDAALLGSANLDMRSLFINFELATVIRDAATVARFHALADELIVASHPASRRRNRAHGVMERGMESLAHLLAPLL